MDDQQTMETPDQGAEQPFTVSGEVSGQEVIFGPGLAGSVSAQENVTVSKGGALIIAAGNDASVVESGALAIPVGGDLTLVNGGAMLIPVGGSADIVNGGAQIISVGGNLNLSNGGSVLMIGQQVTAKNSFFGVLISSETKLEEGSRVLLDTKQAAIFGAVFGAVFALLSWIFRRK
jgi:hypothetical protein